MSAPVRVLAVTDLGPAGAATVAAAAEQVAAAGGELAVVHAIPDLVMARPVFPNLNTDDAVAQAEFPAKVRQALEAQVAAAAPGVTATLMIEGGGPAEVALKAADAWGADLIVVTSVDETSIDSERIVRHAQVPVMVARAGHARGPVVACTDFSDPALPAVRAAAAEARRTGDPLLVVHALEPLPYAVVGIEGYGIMLGSEWYSERRRNAEDRLAEALRDAGVEGTYVAVEGPVVSVLAQTARDHAARLMVIGTVGRTGLTRFLLGSVAESLVRAAPCSTLVVRLKRGEAAAATATPAAAEAAHR
ncbi:MAG: universal stress protein [Kofleriaceae bacterium]